MLITVLFTGCSSVPDSARTGEQSVIDHQLEFHYTGSYEKRIAYVKPGRSGSSKTPVLFLHGSPGRWHNFAEVTGRESLTARADLLLPDRPGYGESAAGYLVPPVKDQSELLFQVLQAENSGPAVIVGHGNGAAVAARIAMERPQSVAALILVSAKADPDLAAVKWYDYLLYAGSFFLPVHLSVSQREIMNLQNDLTEMASQWEKITAPVYVIHATDDSMAPIQNAEFIHRHCKNALVKIIEVEGAGHFLPWTHPQLVADVISRVLTDINDPKKETESSF